MEVCTIESVCTVMITYASLFIVDVLIIILIIYYFNVPAGKTISVQSLEVGVSSSGFQLILDNGATCEVTSKPRRTVLKFPCDPKKEVSSSAFAPVKAYEGDKKLICNYFVDFLPSQYGCPVLLEDNNIIIEAGMMISTKICV